MSGFTLRRMVLDNAVAVMSHCPIPAVRTTGISCIAFRKGRSTTLPLFPLASWLVDAGSGFSLMSTEEMNWSRQHPEEYTSRLVLSTRPTPNLVRGLSGAILNVCLAGVLSPVVLLGVLLERSRVASSPAEVIRGSMYAVGWSLFFAATGLWAALQQAALTLWLALVCRPSTYLLNSSERAWVWSPLSSRFETPLRGDQAHPLLALWDSDEELRESAARRVARATRQRRSGASSELSHYTLLGVSPTATPKEIKAAYKRLALEVHPDRNPHPDAAQRFDELRKAYNTLSNPKARERYDVGGAEFEQVEDNGRKARDALRDLFGGSQFFRLTGDVFLNSFACRVLERVDYTQEELMALHQRSEGRCLQELATFLDGFTVGCANSHWEEQVRRRLKGPVNTGLGAEVAYSIGQEYMRAAAYVEPAAWAFKALSRLHNAIAGAPEKLVHGRNCLGSLLALVRRTEARQALSVDAAWYWGSPELQRRARRVAVSLLYEPGITAEERNRRVKAVEALGKLLTLVGRPYQCATKASVDRLQSSLYGLRSQPNRKADN